MDALTQQVVQIAKKVLNDPTIDEKSTVGKPSSWNSLKHVQLITSIEKEFQIKVGGAKLAQLISIAAILDFLRAQGK